MKLRNLSLTDTSYVYYLNNLHVPQNSIVTVPSHFTEKQVRSAIAPFENLILLQSSIVIQYDLSVQSNEVTAIQEIPVGGGGSGGNLPVELEFTFSDFASGVLPVGIIPANVDTDNIKIVVNNPFNNGATVTVGDPIQPDRLAPSDNSDLSSQGVYTVESTFSYPSDTTVNLYMSGSPTTGSGKVIIFMQ
jgi:hypothetical protein